MPAFYVGVDGKHWELFENNVVKIIMRFPCQSIPRAQTQNDLGLLHFQISLW